MVDRAKYPHLFVEVRCERCGAVGHVTKYRATSRRTCVPCRARARPSYKGPEWVSTRARAYRAWRRCVNPADPDFRFYGARGVQFSFASAPDAARWIIENIGPPPVGMTLDRIDTDGHYAPGNLRWASPREQRLNQRRMRQD